MFFSSIMCLKPFPPRDPIQPNLISFDILDRKRCSPTRPPLLHKSLNWSLKRVIYCQYLSLICHLGENMFWWEEADFLWNRIWLITNVKATVLPNRRVWLYLLVLHLKVLHVLLLNAAAPRFLNDEEIKCTYHQRCQQGLSLTLLNTCTMTRSKPMYK